MAFAIGNDLMDMTFLERSDTSGKLVRISLANTSVVCAVI